MSTIPPDKAKVVIDSVLGTPTIEGGEANYVCCFCPKAGYTVPSHLHVNYRKGRALCHRCGAKYKTLRTLILALCGKVPRSLDDLHAESDIVDAVDEILRSAPSIETVRIKAELPEGFATLTPNPKDRLGRLVLDYLTGTNAKRKQRGVPFEMLAEVGTGYGTEGMLRGYAIFPVHVNGELVTWTSRRVTGFGPKQRHGIFGESASIALFNYDNVRRCRRIFIGEGPFDAFTFQGKFRPTDGGASTLGTVLHDIQARLLDETDAEELVMCYDGDAYDKALKAARRLSGVSSKRVSVMKMGDKDPDELPRSELLAAVKSRVPYGGEMDEVLAMLS